ncbi:MAG: cyclase family protein [Planctomycetes bacterium]|nr:cyclase family protein [Planctomycetota bacterium]
MIRFRSFAMVSAAVLVGVLCGALVMHAAQTGGGTKGKAQEVQELKQNRTLLADPKAKPAGAIKGWQKGKGWGWVWGAEDEVGSLNAMTDATRLAALRLAKQGKVYDLGAAYDRTSYKWPGHSPGEILTFRSPEGVKRQQDLPQIAAAEVNPWGTAWHSCALFINDNVATQIDGLGHVTEGPGCEHKIADHWYNGFKESDWGGNWGPRKCDATTIPPIVARGVMIDVAGFKKVDALPAHYEITPDDLTGALKLQNTELRPGDVVLIRTGTLRYWGETGDDKDGKIKEHDSAGINLDAAKWLVEQHGAMMIGSDTSGLEYSPADEDNAAYRAKYKTFIPVHNYLLIHQGVHIAEFHFLEDLARDKGYEFCYVCMTNKIKGTAAGFTLRPIGIR